MLSIIYTTKDVLLSTKPYNSWREIQDEFHEYKASFGPWSESEVIEFLQFEYKDIFPPAEQQVKEAAKSLMPYVVTFKNAK